MSRMGKFSVVVGIVFVAATLLKMFFGLKDEKEKDKKNFIKLIFVWFAVIFAVLVLFAFQIRPRFFFPVFLLPFVFFAFWLEWLLSWEKKHWALSSAILVSLAVIILNSEATYA
jgi:hypothetical protein